MGTDNGLKSSHRRFGTRLGALEPLKLRFGSRSRRTLQNLGHRSCYSTEFLSLRNVRVEGIVVVAAGELRFRAHFDSKITIT